MTTNAPPSANPADFDDLTGTLRIAINKILQRTDGTLPAKVMTYDRETNRAQVVPLIMILTTTGARVPRAPIASVPVLCIGGGNALINFNLREGDLGWIHANDRDISLFLKTYAESAPNTLRKNSFSDAIFIPDIMRGFTIDPEDNEHAVFQTKDGTVRVSLWPNKVKITAPDGLHVNKLTVDGEAVINGKITGSGGLALSGGGGDSGIISGNLRVNGNIGATGDITAHIPP